MSISFQTVICVLLSSTKIILEKQEETLWQNRIWLGGIGRDLEFEKNQKLYVAGTCEWILNNELFKSWKVGEIEILLIEGIPGNIHLIIHVFCF